MTFDYQPPQWKLAKISIIHCSSDKLYFYLGILHKSEYLSQFLKNMLIIWTDFSFKKALLTVKLIYKHYLFISNCLSEPWFCLRDKTNLATETASPHSSNKMLCWKENKCILYVSKANFTCFFKGYLLPSLDLVAGITVFAV